MKLLNCEMVCREGKGKMATILLWSLKSWGRELNSHCFYGKHFAKGLEDPGSVSEKEIADQNFFFPIT